MPLKNYAIFEPMGENFQAEFFLIIGKEKERKRENYI
jgi:hypothetical protein